MAIIVDKRLMPKNQTINSRKRFIEKYKDSIKNRVKDIVINESMKGIIKGDKKIKIKVGDLDEPDISIEHGTGKEDRVYIGNKRFQRNQKVNRPDKGGKGKGRSGSNQGGGEDDFEFVLTEKEFMELFFDDLELPELVKKQYESSTFEIRHAGYSRSGGPTSLNIRRTMMNALGRRKALRQTNPHLKNLTDDELTALIKKNGLSKHSSNKGQKIQFIEDMDLRYNFKEKQEVPTTKAVMFALLDVSGSMGETEKDIAKRFFVLLNMFLEKNYEQVDIVFVRHAESAEVVDEETFFFDPKSGGTVISSGYRVILDSINKKYNPENWNIYIAQASDGDNFLEDMGATEDLLVNHLLPIVQYFAYINIESSAWGPGQSLMMGFLKNVASAHTNLQARSVNSLHQIWLVFRSLFERKSK